MEIQEKSYVRVTRKESSDSVELNLSTKLLLTNLSKKDLVNADSKLVEDVCREVAAWMKTRLLDDEIHEDVNRSAIIQSLTYVPYNWRMDTNATPELYQKHLLNDKITAITMELDNYIDVGCTKQYQFFNVVSNLFYKCTALHYESEEEIRADPLFVTATGIEPIFGKRILLWWDAMEELKEKWGFTRDNALYLAMRIKDALSLQVWCGHGNGNDYLRIRPLREFIRFYKAGGPLFLEVIFALENIAVPAKIRENAYWSRCYHIGPSLMHVYNDIISAPREFEEEKRTGFVADNAVVLKMHDRGISMQEALQIWAAEHDEQVQELRI